MNIDKIINIIRDLNEEAPTMSVASGGIAGINPGEDPPVRKKKKPTIIARGCMPGARKRWREGI
jgi:hypothetical protein|tara:strand:+ start:5494 stop:5685 length:192 start_codon:yes stop_codon:yes gene_type:complete